MRYNKSMAKLTFSMPEEILKDLTSYCDKNGLAKSELLRHLIRIEIYHEKSLEMRGGENVGKMEKK